MSIPFNLIRPAKQVGHRTINKQISRTILLTRRYDVSLSQIVYVHDTFFRILTN